MRIPKHHIEYKHKRRTMFILALCVLLMFYFFRDASFALRALTAASFLILFYIFDHVFDVRFRRFHYLFIVLITIFGILLSPLYYVYPNYDKVQHLLMPILLCSMAFYMISKLKLELKWLIVFTALSVVAVLGIFEIGEYALDYLFDMKLQGVYLRDMAGLEKFNIIIDRIDDTMIDMFLGIIGSGLYSVYKVFSFKKKGYEI